MSIPLQSTAQTAPTRTTAEQPISWWCYFGTHRFSHEWSLWTELQLRRANVADTWQQILPRIGVNYHLNPNVFFTLGYAYIWTYPYGAQPIPLDKPRPEHRPWQQMTLLHSAQPVDFQHRFRLEQRFLQNWTNIEPTTGLRNLTDGYELQNRLRYRFLTTIPVSYNEQGKTRFFATLYNEIFINFGGNIGFNIFDQNRLGAMFGWQYLPNANIQIGYMNQIIQKPNGREVENNHAFVFWHFFNIDFRQEKPFGF